MGYAIYQDAAASALGIQRFAGYAIPAICDVADCTAEINRGMGYRCEGYTEYIDVDSNGNPCAEDDPDWAEEREEQREGCQLHFCTEHEPHHVHGDHVTPKPDVPEWMRWLLVDDTWTQWRADNPDWVQRMRDILGDNARPEPGTPEWAAWALTDPTWRLWRDEHPQDVDELHRLAASTAAFRNGTSAS